MYYTKTCSILFMLLLSTTLPATARAASANPDGVEAQFSSDEVARALGSRADEFRDRGALNPRSNVDDNAGEADDEDADVKSSAANADYRSLIHFARGGAGAPIWGPFTTAFRQCAPGCVPANYNIYRRGRHTCHSQGRAIDVGAIICDGAEHTALAGGRFAQVVSCLSQSGLYVLYRERRGRGKTRDHYDHVHVSIGCTL